MTAISRLLAGLGLAAIMACGSVPANAGDHSWNQGWGGLYAGVNVGWIGKDYDWKFGPAVVTPGLAFSLSHDDAIVGGHVGIQTQRGNLVLGVEAAYSGSGVFGNDWAVHPGWAGSPAQNSIARMGEIFTLGPRVGWARDQNLLLYVTGGYAVANIQTAGIDPATGVMFLETTDRHHGWFIGGGIERVLRDNIIIGLEYQHIEFDTESHKLVCSCREDWSRDVDGSADIVRARLSFKLGRPEVIEPLK